MSLNTKNHGRKRGTDHLESNYEIAETLQYNDYLQRVGIHEARSLLPENLHVGTSTMKLMIHRERYESSSYGPLPVDLSSFETIPPELFQLENNESFVLFFMEYLENEDDDTYGILLAFGTRQSCLLLSQATHIFIGSCSNKIIPDLFYQCFSISTLFGLQHNKMICPRIMVLCSHNTENMYIRLFASLFEKFDEFGIAPESVKWNHATINVEDAQRSAINHISQTLFQGSVSNVVHVFHYLLFVVN